MHFSVLLFLRPPNLLKSVYLNKREHLPVVAIVACVSPTASSQRHPDSGEPQKPQTVVSSGLVEARHASDGRGSVFSLLLPATKVPKSHSGTGPRAAGRDLGSEAEPLEVDLYIAANRWPVLRGAASLLFQVLSGTGRLQVTILHPVHAHTHIKAHTNPSA